MYSVFFCCCLFIFPIFLLAKNIKRKNKVVTAADERTWTENLHQWFMIQEYDRENWEYSVSYASKCSDIFLTCLYHRSEFMCTMNWKWSCLTANDVFSRHPMRFCIHIHTQCNGHGFYARCNSYRSQITYLRQNDYNQQQKQKNKTERTSNYENVFISILT